ncbi:hypothetical protein [Bacillus bombysepticus]|uniref:hypothetical protein n=1 Tax=Bacillus bombysepticus TaxID=658666 RepID=UPI00301956FD
MDKDTLEFHLKELDRGEEVRFYSKEEEDYFHNYLMENGLTGGLDKWYEFDCVVFQVS